MPNIFEDNQAANLVALSIANTHGRYTPTDDFVASLGLKEERDEEQQLRYIYSGDTLDSAVYCMIVDEVNDRRKIALLKQPDIDGYDRDAYDENDAREHSQNAEPISVFFGYVPDEQTLLIIMAATQWVVPPVITQR